MSTATAQLAAEAQASAERLEELRAYVKELATDYAWREDWNRRHESPDGWESPIRVAGDVIDAYAQAIARGDLASLDSRERFLRRMLGGELFDAGAVGRRKATIAAEPLCRLHVA